MMPERRTETLAVVIPCYRVADHIEGVVRSLPSWVTWIICVDDASPDATGGILARLAADFPRLRVLRHERNRGVGGAMATGYAEALRLGADYIVKLDGDGQMDIAELPGLLRPLLESRADYAKGNRFRHRRDLGRMPKLRLFGNVGLTFLTKLASGYWHIFDVQNGYLAITRQALQSVPLAKLDPSYCFENSMLTHLNINDAHVVDVAMPAIYGDETSSMQLSRVLLTFPAKLGRMFLRRVLVKYLVYDVSPVAIYLLFGTALFAFSLLFGGYHWWQSIASGVAASTGTVVLALLPFLMAFNLFLQAIDLDIRNSPRPRPPRRELTVEEVPAMFRKASEPVLEQEEDAIDNPDAGDGAA